MFGAIVRTARASAHDAQVRAEAMALTAKKRLLLVAFQRFLLDHLQRDWDPEGTNEHRSNCVAAAAELDTWVNGNTHSSIPPHVHCDWLVKSSEVKEMHNLIYGFSGEHSLESRVLTAELLIDEWSRPFR